MHRPDLLRQMTADGWTVIDDDGFIGLVGPFLQRGSFPDLQFAFITDHRHRNLRGVLQGGALMTFADRVLGLTARAGTAATRTATVQLDTHFIDAVHIGTLLEARPRLLRATSQLMFMTTDLTVDGKLVATANGVWKKLAPAKS
jgi:acyl-coenzyme A thioesterase PaaI-like protein